MKGLIIKLVVLVVFTVMAFPIYSKSGGLSSPRIVDANGLTVGELFSTEGTSSAGIVIRSGREVVILKVTPSIIFGTRNEIDFKDNNCIGQGFVDFFGLSALQLVAVVDDDNSVYKAPDMSATQEAFTAESRLETGNSGCLDISESVGGRIPADRLGELGVFTPFFELK